MRQLVLGLTVVLIWGWVPAAATAGVVFDNFNDGNTDGWVFPFNPNTTQFPGSWDVENQRLVQHLTSDHNAGLLNNLVFTDQVIQTEVKTLGYGGVVLWHQNDDWVSVVVYPAWTGVVVFEVLNGQWTTTPYNHHTASDWYDLKVAANSATGELAVYLDGVYLFTHTTSVPGFGLSGVISGNEVGYFDNFRLTSGDVAPEPGSLTLWVCFGLAGICVARWYGQGAGRCGSSPANRGWVAG
jgi:hypothetical protein